MLHHVVPWPLVQLGGAAGGDELDPAPCPVERAASFEVHVAEVALGEAGPKVGGELVEARATSREPAPGARGTGPCRMGPLVETVACGFDADAPTLGLAAVALILT